MNRSKSLVKGISWERWFRSSGSPSNSKFQATGARVLTASVFLVAVLAIYRFYDYWTTGFYVSDEYGYFYDAIHGQVYSDRWFFSDLNTLIFRALGIRSVDAFSYLLPFYIIFWASLTLYFLFRTLKLLSFDERTVALSLASSFALISFVLLSLGFLTEPVGLCFAMLGIYLLVRVLKAKTGRDFVLSSFLAACSFGAAAGTREPYNAFLAAGVVLVLGIAYSRRREALQTARFPVDIVLLFGVLAFALTAVFFLVVPTDVYSQQVAPLTQAAIGDITGPHALTTVGGASYPWYERYIATNTLLIFAGGVVLGWGPLSFGIALAGFVVVLRRSRKSELDASFVLVTALTALASYLVVSFIFAPDPSYFSFENYSTIIRFSDTALPAYFVCAPFFLGFVSKSRKRIVGLGVVVLVFLAVAVPVYQTYAASNFNYTSGQNPFLLGYKTDAAVLRDYFSGLPPQGPLNLVGVPYGWTFTPGVQDVPDLNAYSIGQSPVTPTIVLANFTTMQWPTFYIYDLVGVKFPSDQAFLAQMLNPTFTTGGSSSTYTVVGVQTVLHGGDFTLYKVELSWP